MRWIDAREWEQEMRTLKGRIDMMISPMQNRF